MGCSCCAMGHSSNRILSALLVVLSVAVPTRSATQARVDADAGIAPAESIMRHVYVLADDSMRGRGTPSVGYDKAARYVAELFRQHGIVPIPGHDESGIERYFHPFKFEVPVPDGRLLGMESYNVVGLVQGADPELASQQVVVGAHLDHEGVVDGQIFNGASDNASGVAVMLEVARLIARCYFGLTRTGCCSISRTFG